MRYVLTRHEQGAALMAQMYGRVTGRPDQLYLIQPDEFVVASIPLQGNNIDVAQLQAAMRAHLMVTD